MSPVPRDLILRAHWWRSTAPA